MTKRYMGYTDRAKGYADLEGRFSSYSSKAEGLVGDSVADDRALLNTLVNVTMQPVGGRLDVVGIPRIASNVTIPANVTLKFLDGAYLAPDGGVTVTHNGRVENTLDKIFGGGGAIAFGATARTDRMLPHWWGAKADGATDDSTPIQSAINAASAVHATVAFPRATYKVGAITLKQNARLVGDGLGATVILGTAGVDIFTFEAAGGLQGYAIEKMTVSGGKDQIVVPSTVDYVTHFFVTEVDLSGHSGAAVRAGCQIEEWHFDKVQMIGGQYGFKKENTGATKLMDKCTFKDVTTNGQSINGWRLESLLGNTLTWINPIMQTSGQDGFWLDGGFSDLLFVNTNTEGNGQTGKNNRTTGGITAATNALVVASGAGLVIGDPIVVAGAGANGVDLFTTITNVVGTAITLAANAVTTVVAAKVTNAQYDDFHFTNSIASSQRISFVGGAIGGEGSGGHLRFSIDARATTALSLIAAAVNSATPVYDPIQIASVFGGNAPLRQPSNLLTEAFRRVSFPTTAGEPNKTIIPSPPGLNLILAMRDSTDNGGGTYGLVEIRKFDGGRTRVFYVDPTAGLLSTRNRVMPGDFGAGTGAGATGLGEGSKGIVYGNAAPTAGTWVLGDRVFNGAPAVGNPKGWVCTVAGTPGTWVSEGNL